MSVEKVGINPKGSIHAESGEPRKWTVVQRNPALRKLWWAGIPTKLRATMWQNAVGNTLVLSKGNACILIVEQC